jgi:hypothetical protein
MSINPGYYHPSAVKENNTTRTIIFFQNFKRLLLGYSLSKTVNHLAMMLAQQKQEVLSHFFISTYYGNNECTVLVELPFSTTNAGSPT